MTRFIYTTFILLLLAGLGAGVWAYFRVTQPYKGYPATEQIVEIPPGSGVESIGRRLIESGVVVDRLAFRWALWRTGEARRLQAGEYRFDRPTTAVDVVRKIARGDVHRRPLTVPEGLTLREIAALYENKGFGSAEAFMKAAEARTSIADLDPAAEDLEGYLFPDTYALPKHLSATRLVGHMVDKFREAFGPVLRQEAAARGLSVRQAVTLASIIEEETAQASERPLVSAVYHNRLRIGMALQSDPTVIFALVQAGRYTGNIRRDDLDFDSPYNTYRYPGLPPGPIAAPSRTSLEAAVRPATTPYLYFVSRNDGTHAFAQTLAEHNQNVRQFQILYFRERRLKGLP